jgi:hypothetical protein
MPSSDLVAVTVNSTVMESTGNWISESAPAALALSKSSRNNAIASDKPRPTSDAAFSAPFSTSASSDTSSRRLDGSAVPILLPRFAALALAECHNQAAGSHNAIAKIG